MSKLEQKVKPYVFSIHAGPGGEDSDVYCWNASQIPSWVKTVDDPDYSKAIKLALNAAKELVRYSGQDISLNFLVEQNNLFILN